ncbi:MAG: LysM peptidoglycan-binding domain-containing protein [Chloroflexota bacterium]
MFLRALLICVVLIVPFHARAAQYVVRAGDSLQGIALRYHIPVRTLAHINDIRNVDLIQIGRVLFIPATQRTLSYRVSWGDTLSGLASRFGLTIASIRAMNPHLGSYPLAGEVLHLCSGCDLSAGPPTISVYRASMAGSGRTYRVLSGDTLSAIAAKYSTSPQALLLENQLSDPNQIVIGTWLRLPPQIATSYDSWRTRSLIAGYARLYGINPALPLAIAWQESGFNESSLSRTGAIGVMQVEPYTSRHIERLLGRPFNLWNTDDNIHAGVFWLGQLLAYYAGDQRLAVAAYYEGTRNIARHGLFADTVQYVNNVNALETQFAG